MLLPPPSTQRGEKRLGIRLVTRITAVFAVLFLFGYIFNDSVSRNLFVSPLLDTSEVHDDRYEGIYPGTTLGAYKDYKSSAVFALRKHAAELGNALLKTKLAGRDEFNVLVMGGSVSWGSFLHDRSSDSYASILRRYLCTDSTAKSCNVDNLAIRATGTDIPHLCFRSLLTNPKGFVGPEATSAPDRRYDVIILEFSVNGVWKLDELVTLMMARYPQAQIIYLDLHSAKHFNVEGRMNQYKVFINPAINERHLETGQLAPKYVKFPYVSDAEEELMYFASDRHHLNGVGHMYMAREILELLMRTDFPKNPHLGPWPSGDKCTSWFKTGDTFAAAAVTGGSMVKWDLKNDKFGFDIPYEGTLTLPPRDEPVEVKLLVMAVGDGKYPGATFILDDNTEAAIIDKADYPHMGHITHILDVGSLPTSDKISTLKILANHTRPTEIYPFRLVGYAMIPKQEDHPTSD